MRIIRPLRKEDTRSGFSCGEKAIDDFLSKRAWRQHSQHQGSRVRVLADSESHEVLGLYSLSVKHLERRRLDGVVPGAAPPHPLGVFYVGYFGVALAHQGKGLGRELMRDALHLCLNGAESFGVVGVFLDSLDTRSTDFYQRLGFECIPRSAETPSSGPQPMFISMATLLASRPPSPGPSPH
jgi:GNAT superfamily N-acetyltransferase